MSSKNHVSLIGRLGADPELRYLPNGDAVVSFSLATSMSWKDKNTGDKREETEWHKIVFFKRPAEVIGQYCAKGSRLSVEGRLRTRKYQDKSGNDRYTTEIVGQDFIMLDNAADREGRQEPRNRDEVRADARAYAEASGGTYSSSVPYSAGGGLEDEIPFDRVRELVV